jgi:ABC-type molybdate transport system substrate-binding protein
VEARRRKSCAEIHRDFHRASTENARSAGCAGAAGAAEITVLAGMGVVSGLRDVAPAFENSTGHKVIVSFEAGPSLMQKVNAGVPADLVTHYPEVIDDLIKQGKVVDRRVDFARAGVGVAVKAGAPKPDIVSTEAFKHAMLAAKSIAYSTGASGIIAAKLMERLGIAEQLKDRIKLVDGVAVAEIVAKGGSRDRHSADQRHPARCRRRLRRAVAGGTTGLRRFRRRRAGVSKLPDAAHAP